MMDIRAARLSDVSAAIAALGDAFAHDPLMHHFFAASPTGVLSTAMEFFSILLRARIALNMPAHVLRENDAVRGLVMGYDTSRPAWSAELTSEWLQLENRVPGLADRFTVNDAISDAHRPADPHYYLGVIGIHPTAQGLGAGRMLLDTFCARSKADPLSCGVYLETSNADSLRFYLANGFAVRGEGALGDTPLWCVFKSH